MVPAGGSFYDLFPHNLMVGLFAPVFGFAVLALANPSLTREEREPLSTVVAVVVLAVVVGVIAAILMPLFKQMQKRLDAINGLLREQIAGTEQQVVLAVARCTT